MLRCRTNCWRLCPKEGYAFAKELTLKINGQTVAENGECYSESAGAFAEIRKFEDAYSNAYNFIERVPIITGGAAKNGGTAQVCLRPKKANRVCLKPRKANCQAAKGFGQKGCRGLNFAKLSIDK